MLRYANYAIQLWTIIVLVSVLRLQTPAEAAGGRGRLGSVGNNARQPAPRSRARYGSSQTTPGNGGGGTANACTFPRGEQLAVYGVQSMPAVAAGFSQSSVTIDISYCNASPQNFPLFNARRIVNEICKVQGVQNCALVGIRSGSVVLIISFQCLSGDIAACISRITASIATCDLQIRAGFPATECNTLTIKEFANPVAEPSPRASPRPKMSPSPRPAPSASPSASSMPPTPSPLPSTPSTPDPSPRSSPAATMHPHVSPTPSASASPEASASASPSESLAPSVSPTPTTIPSPSPSPMKIPDGEYTATLLAKRRRNDRKSLPGGTRFKDFYMFDDFDSFNSERWFMAGQWTNGSPFANGWDPNYFQISHSTLSLFSKKDPFVVPSWDNSGLAGKTLDYTSGEIRTREFFGYGCYATCMKPIPVAGVVSSFFAYAGKFDSPDGDTPQDSPPGNGKLHNEIDVEFLGFDPTVLQTNWFSRNTSVIESPSSGNEGIHQLGFNASENFHVYGFRWTGDDESGTGGGIEWFVDGHSIRKVITQGSSRAIPRAEYTYLRMMANSWVVDDTAWAWAGIPPQDFPGNANAQFKWVMYTETLTDGSHGRDTCVMPKSC